MPDEEQVHSLPYPRTPSEIQALFSVTENSGVEFHAKFKDQEAEMPVDIRGILQWISAVSHLMVAGNEPSATMVIRFYNPEPQRVRRVAIAGS